MLRSHFAVALLSVVSLGLPLFGQNAKPDASKQEAPKLEWKLEKGKTFYQEMTTETKQEMTVMGMNITQNQKQTFYFSWTPVEKDKDGNWKIKQKIEGVKMDIQIGGNPITFDSTKDTTTTNPLSDFFKALVGAEFTLTLSPQMKVTKIEGRDEFLKKLTTANQQMEPLLKQILSDEALKQMADPAFGVVPSANDKGSTWERKSTLNMGPIGTYETTYKYTDKGKDEKDKNLEKISVDTTLKYVAPTAAAGGALPFRITTANLQSKDGSGTILFDIAKGRVASSDLSLKLDGTLTIEVGGQTNEVKLNQTQKTTVKTTDENPVKKAS